MGIPSEAITVGALRKFLGAHSPKPGRVLVIGSKVYDGTPDRRRYYRDAIGLDMLGGEGVDIVHDLEKPLGAEWGKFDHVDLCSVLEHVRRPWRLAENVMELMAPKATLLVSVPFVWRQHAYPSDFWRMTPEALDVLFPAIRWEDKAFVVGGKIRKRVHGKEMEDGLVYMARAETVGFGCLTS